MLCVDSAGRSRQTIKVKSSIAFPVAFEDIAEGKEDGDRSGDGAGQACDRSIAQRLVDLQAAESSSGSSHGHVERIMAGFDGYGGSDDGKGTSEAGSRHWAASTTNNADDDAVFAALKPPDGTLRQARFALYSAGIACETLVCSATWERPPAQAISCMKKSFNHSVGYLA